MVFEGVSFVTASWKGKTEADFLKHEKHHGLSENQLKEAWKLIDAENKPKHQSQNSDRPAKPGV